MFDLFKRFYGFQGMVQFDSADGSMTVCGDQVKWLCEYACKAFTYAKAESEAYNYFVEKYPEYAGFIRLI